MLIFGTRTSHIARVMHIIVLSVVTMVTYINLSRYIRIPLIMSHGGHQLLIIAATSSS